MLGSEGSVGTFRVGAVEQDVSVDGSIGVSVESVAICLEKPPLSEWLCNVVNVFSASGDQTDPKNSVKGEEHDTGFIGVGETDVVRLRQEGGVTCLSD